MNGQASGKATREESTFRLAYQVGVTVNAPVQTVWALLTDGPKFPQWNSTVISLEGRIALNEKIKVKSTSAPDRVFTLRVSELAAPAKMVWRDGSAPMFQGVRTYSLTATPAGGCTFHMEEVLSGLMLPMIKGSLPDFRPTFETYAADLKRAAEQR